MLDDTKRLDWLIENSGLNDEDEPLQLIVTQEAVSVCTPRSEYKAAVREAIDAAMKDTR